MLYLLKCGDFDSSTRVWTWPGLACVGGSFPALVDKQVSLGTDTAGEFNGDFCFCLPAFSLEQLNYDTSTVFPTIRFPIRLLLTTCMHTVVDTM